METIEYFETQDKGDWGDGPWQGEPDKRQWQDKVTRLPCLMVRGPSGSWCGYVGVPPGHPAHGLHYDGITQEAAEARRKRNGDNMKAWSAAGGPPLDQWVPPLPYLPDPPMSAYGRAVSELYAHGGLTYADFCSPITREEWESFRLREPKWRSEAERFPHGDSARHLKKWAGAFDSYDRWVEIAQSTAICHVTEPGDAEPVWWFGFDCAHAGDLMPGHRSILREIGMPEPSWASLAGSGYHEVYRTVAYVEGQCAMLAFQLQAITLLALPCPSNT